MVSFTYPLSIIISVYNEIHTIESVLKKIDRLNFNGYNCQIIIVDDGSNDGTTEILKDINSVNPNYKIVYNDTNCGKGYSIKKGIQYINSEHVALVDADEEVDISVIVEWLSIDSLKIDAVIGIRKYEYIDTNLYYFGRYILSSLFKKLFHTNIQDPLVGLKLIKSSVIKSMHLRSQGFGIDSEILVRLIRGGYKFKQKPIKYTPRNVDGGKKIRFYHAIDIMILWFKEVLK